MRHRYKLLLEVHQVVEVLEHEYYDSCSERDRGDGKPLKERLDMGEVRPVVRWGSCVEQGSDHREIRDLDRS
jgi:hypothetical protein